jgi:hypothetical protein
VTRPALLLALASVGCSWMAAYRRPAGQEECSRVAPSLDVAGATASGAAAAALVATAVFTDCAPGDVWCPDSRKASAGLAVFLGTIAVVYGFSAATGFADANRCLERQLPRTQGSEVPRDDVIGHVGH